LFRVLWTAKPPAAAQEVEARTVTLVKVRATRPSAFDAARLLGRRCHAPLRRAPFGRRMNRPVPRGAARPLVRRCCRTRASRTTSRGSGFFPLLLLLSEVPPVRHGARGALICAVWLCYSSMPSTSARCCRRARLRFASREAPVRWIGAERHARALQADQRVPARARAAARGGEDFAPRGMSSAAAALRWRRTLRRLAQSRQRGWARHVSAIICCEDRTLWLQSLGCARK
jgi:hypothetical protein